MNVLINQIIGLFVYSLILLIYEFSNTKTTHNTYNKPSHYFIFKLT